ncbi:hypothetical protein HTG_10680 [Natrinema mahii]|nr:hypothetical protein HTG_10680 [Natrinema mahii]
MPDEEPTLAGWMSPIEPLRSKERQRNPFPWLRKQRRSHPVRFNKEQGYWEIFGYDAAKEALTDHDRFKSTPNLAVRNGLIRDTIFAVDPPRHTKLRKPADEFFKSDNIREYGPVVERLANDLIDDIADDGEMEFIEDFAQPIQVRTITRMLGLPSDDIDTFVRWNNIITRGQFSSVEQSIQKQEQASTEMNELFSRLARERREEPGDDFISLLAQSEIDGEPMPIDNIVGYGILLLLAGNATTTLEMANAMTCLWNSDPGLFDDLAGNDDALATAIEEVLRYRPTFPKPTRMASRDFEFHGKQLQKGELVMVWIASANRDGSTFDNPETFVPDRSPNPHLSFGHGVHICIGATLSRLVMRKALGTLFERLTDIRLVDDELDPIWNPALHGFKELNIEFEPK